MLVCNTCSKHKIKLKNKEDDKTKKERVCDKCYDSKDVSKAIDSEDVSKAIDSKDLLSNELTKEQNTFQTKLRNGLTDPSQNFISVFLSIFHKHWLRIKYLQYYQEKIKEFIGETHNNKMIQVLSAPTKMISNSTAKMGKMFTKSVSNVIPLKKGNKSEENPSKQAQDITHLQTKTANTEIPEIPVISCGVLWVNVMTARNIPDCDSFAAPDAYCEYYVTSTDKYQTEDGKCIFPPKYSTKTKSNTFTPEWNEDQSIIITNTTGNLVCELWDRETVGDNELLGKVEIPLHTLYLRHSCGETIIDDWFEVKICDDFKNKSKYLKVPNVVGGAKRVSANMIGGAKNVMGSAKNVTKLLPIKSSETKNVKTIQNDSNELDLNSKKDVKCCIRLQLKLKSSWHANFISHFDPVPPEKKPTKFDLDVTMTEVNKLMSIGFAIIDRS
eukprot:56064_1